MKRVQIPGGSGGRKNSSASRDLPVSLCLLESIGMCLSFVVESYVTLFVCEMLLSLI